MWGVWNVAASRAMQPCLLQPVTSYWFLINQHPIGVSTSGFITISLRKMKTLSTVCTNKKTSSWNVCDIKWRMAQECLHLDSNTTSRTERLLCKTKRPLVFTFWTCTNPVCSSAFVQKLENVSSLSMPINLKQMNLIRVQLFACSLPNTFWLSAWSKLGIQNWNPLNLTGLWLAGKLHLRGSPVSHAIRGRSLFPRSTHRGC